MESDLTSLKKIDQAVMDGKLEMSDGDAEFLESVRDRIIAQRWELTKKQRQWLGDIQARIMVW